MLMKQTFGKTKASCCHVITNSSIKAEERNEMKLDFRQPHFLLCSSCFWCASYLNFRGTVEVCPSCMNGKVESMPLSDKEIYTFRYDAIRGVTLEFMTKLN
jgi:hypothetical protein